MTSASHASGTDRVAEVAVSFDADLVVNIQGDEPLLDPKMIDECVEALKAALLEGDAVGLSTVVKQVGEQGFMTPAWLRWFAMRGAGRSIFSRSLIPYPGIGRRHLQSSSTSASMPIPRNAWRGSRSCTCTFGATGRAGAAASS